MNTKCTIKHCTSTATVLAIIDRPAAAVKGTTYWHGHMETPYCAKHAIERPSEEGFDQFQDSWTLRPLRYSDTQWQEPEERGAHLRPDEHAPYTVPVDPADATQCESCQ